MVEPVTITLASIKTFVSVAANCQKIVATINVALNFAEDFQDAKLQLEMLASRVQVLVEEREVLRDDLTAGEEHHERIWRSLAQINSLFEHCGKILKWYRQADRNKPCPDEALESELFDDETLPIEERTPSATQAVEPDKNPLDTVGIQNSHKSQKPEKWHRLFKWGKRKDKSAILTDKGKQKAIDDLPDLKSSSGLIPTIIVPQIDRAASENQDAIATNKQIKWRRGQWVLSDKENLKDATFKIRIHLTDVEKLLSRLARKHGRWTLPTSDEVAVMWPYGARISKCLLLLSDALSAINYAGRQELFFSLRLRENHMLTRTELEKLLLPGKISVAQDADVFLLRRHFSKFLEDDGHLFAIECRPPEKHIQQNLPHDVVDLAEISSLDVAPQEGEMKTSRSMQQWGRISGGNYENQTAYVIYHKTNSIRRSTLNLVDMFNDRNYRKQMMPVHTAGLARLILYSHLYLAEYLKKQSQSQPKPSDYIYYDQTAHKAVWDTKDPLILSPWLRIGFGGRTDDDGELGEGAGVTAAQNFFIPEIGLMLWQLGTGTTLDYEENVSTLITEAIDNTSELRKRMGLPYAELVQTCLSYIGQPHHLASAEEKLEEVKMIKNCISTLTFLETKYPGAASTCILENENEQDQLSVAAATIHHQAESRQDAESHQDQRSFLSEPSQELLGVGDHVPMTESVTLTEPSSRGDPVSMRAPTVPHEGSFRGTNKNSKEPVESSYTYKSAKNTLLKSENVPRTMKTTTLTHETSQRTILEKLQGLIVPTTELSDSKSFTETSDNPEDHIKDQRKQDEPIPAV